MKIIEDEQATVSETDADRIFIDSFELQKKLDNDIFVMRKKEEKKPVKSFLKILTGTVLTITGFFLLKKFFKKS